jgi:ADP-heptose:LPS heptosyltransferase
MNHWSNARVSLNLRKILLIRTDRIGDVMLSLPMLPLIKEQFPLASITVMVQSYTRELVDGHSCVDDVLIYDAPTSVSSFLAWARMLRRRGFDAVILPYPRFRLSLLAYAAGIPLRIATGYRWYSFLFTHKIFEHRKDARHHELEYNLHLLSVMGIDSSAKKITFELPQSADAEKTVSAFLSANRIAPGESFAVLHPGSGGSARDWSAGKFSALGNRLQSDMGLKIVVTGGAQEARLVHQVCGSIQPTPASSAGEFSLTELAALVKRARLFVSNSTGPLHIAAAVGTPVAAFYPPIRQCSPTRWGPWTDKKIIFEGNNRTCPLCKGGPCRSDVCMNQITVDTVEEGIKLLLQEGYAP